MMGEGWEYKEVKVIVDKYYSIILSQMGNNQIYFIKFKSVIYMQSTNIFI